MNSLNFNHLFMSALVPRSACRDPRTTWRRRFSSGQRALAAVPSPTVPSYWPQPLLLLRALNIVMWSVSIPAGAAAITVRAAIDLVPI